MTDPATHFESYGEEPAKLAEFYASLFGWRLEKAPGIVHSSHLSALGKRHPCHPPRPMLGAKQASHFCERLLASALIALTVRFVRSHQGFNCLIGMSRYRAKSAFGSCDRLGGRLTIRASRRTLSCGWPAARSGLEQGSNTAVHLLDLLRTRPGENRGCRCDKHRCG